MKRFTILIAAAVMLLAIMLQPVRLWGQVVSGTTYSTPSTSGLPTGWSGSDGSGTNYIKLIASSHYIQTSNFTQNGFTSITIKARQFGGPSTAQAKITVSWYYNNTETVLGTIDPSNTTLTNYTIASPANPTGNTEGYIKIQCKGASSSKGSGVSEVTINYTSSGGGSASTVTYDFTNIENFLTTYPGETHPTAGTTINSFYYTNGDAFAASGSTQCSFNSGNYFFLGKSGAYLQLPAFSFDVEKIEVVGKSGASGSVVQNIYVGDQAVSTSTTGANGVTNSYTIADGYQTAGTVYKLKVTSNHNTQITQIKVYEKESSDPEISVTTTSLSGFTYSHGNGPSAAQSFAVSGSNLTANITVTAPTNYQVCLIENGTYANSVTLTQTSGSVSSTNVYVRLQAGLAVNASYSGNVSITSTGATNKTVGLSGSVTGYTVTYNCNGGTSGCPATPVNNVPSGSYTLAAAPTKTNYTFAGWNDGTTTYNAGASYTISGNVTFTAQWTPNFPSITITPTSFDVEVAGEVIEMTLTPVNIATPSYTLVYYTTSGATVTTTKPTWFGDVEFSGNTLYIAVEENDGVARHAYFKVKSGDVYSELVTVNQAAITVATPEFDVDEGTYYEDQLVDITCETNGATIYYTTDGSTPSANNGTEYDGNGVSIEEGETTLKAIAIKNNVSSSVATATYTVVTPLTTMDAIFTASASANTYYVTLGNWVVSGVSGKTSYVTDNAGKGFIAYYNNSSGTGFAVNNILSGTVQADLTRFNGAAEFTNLTTSTTNISVATGGSVTVITNKTIADLSGVCTGGVYKLSGLTYSSSTQLLSDGVNTIKPYNQLYGDMSFVDGETYNVTGVYLQYNSTKEILPRSSADIVEVHDPAITTSPATLLSVPNYIKGTPESGIDTEILTVNGANLTADITVALEKGASSDFEMSTDLETWGHSITLTQSNGSVANAEIAVRLKVGKSVDDYSDRIELSSTGATTKYVNVTGSVTYAHVTYNGNGEGVTSVPEDDTDYEYGDEVTVLGEGSMARTGYEFDGWNTSADGSGLTYIPGDNEHNTFNITANTNLFALWQPIVYNLNVDEDMVNGSVSFKVGGEDATTAPTGQTVTIIPNPDSGYGLSSVSVNSGAVTVTNNTFVMPASNVTVSATFVPTVIDEMTLATTGVSGTSYSDWVDKVCISEAVYAGQSAGGNNAIQLRDPKNSNTPGIVTTTTGGKVKKVSVSWNSNTISDRYITIYGKNSAYNGYSDLYDNNTIGTSLGTIVCGTSTELTVSGDYEYIGIKASDPLYLDEIEITWAAPTYALSYDANGGTGSMTDPSSPYIYNASVTVLEKANTITAPSGKMFARWDTNEDGNGTSYAPGDIFSMPKNDMTLYAIWEDECNETATMAATSGTKEYVNDAGELSFKINLSSKVTELSGCAAITEYGFVYSTNGTTPTVGGANCTKIVKGTEYTTANTVFEHELTSATLGATYKICSYATNLAGTAYGTEVTVAIDADYPSYTISYSTNGTSEASTTKIYQGNAISDLIEPTPANVPAGYTFKGWFNGDYALSNSAPTFVKNGDAISANLTLKAVFAIGTTGEGEFTKSYGWEDADDASVWTITDAITKTSGQGYNSSSYAGRINSNHTYVTFKDKVKVKEFSFAFKRTSNNDNYNVYIETSLLGDSWEAIETYAMSSFDKNGTYAVKTHTFDGTTAKYVRFHCYNTTAERYVDDVTITYDAEYTTYSNYCTSVSPQTAISGTITAGHLTTDGTIAAGTAVYLTSPLTINSGFKLTVNGAIGNVNPANLIIEDGAQLILQSTNTGVSATVKKETYAATAKDAKSYYWYAISSAVDNPNISSETNLITEAVAPYNYDLYRYNETKNAGLPWENYRNDAYNETFTTLEPGRGYLYRNASDLSIAMTGEINVADFNYEVTKTGSGVLAGFNLIGNPYSHDIYKGEGTAIPNGSGLLRTGFYYMEPTTGKWTIGTDGSTAIKPNQGILVQTDKDGDIAMTNTTASAAKYNNDNIMFKVANSQYSDETYAWFDKGRGLNKISHRNAEVPMIYINQDGEDYAIATMSDDTKMFSLNFKAMTMGKYTLSYKTKGEFNYLHVIDRFTGEDVDMLLEGEYSFVASPSDSDARFIVKLAYLPDYSDGEGDIFAYQNGSDIFVSGEGELQIFDVMGRFVMSERINGVKTISADELSKGVYVLRLVGNGMKTQKIVVK